MHFVGRKWEIKKIIKAIERGDNVIVKGKYGIGRTSLIKNVAKARKNDLHFMFVDFSLSSAKICQVLLRELLPEKRFIQDRIYTRFKLQNFKTSLFMIVNEQFNDKRKHIIVFDNIAKITYQKSTFIRSLAWAKRFHFIAIVEDFLPKKDLSLLRAELIPQDIVTLSYLPVKDACEFFKCIARTKQFDWPDSYIKMLAKVSHGYPLGMREQVSSLSGQNISK